MAKEGHDQLNLTVVALVALVAIVGLVALVLNVASLARVSVSTGGSLVSAAEPADENVVGDLRKRGGGCTCSDPAGACSGCDHDQEYQACLRNCY